ncbi:Mth938-like domain-containing protein [Sphingomonas sp. PR090111-T3T-6A]|uniref:Mth938-like domain-containing protein n=1 Tax=Sphingomonas sp. PR090111-T3T-6A TaxID=685778 RepID=UPI00037F16D5|nr:MTH938/NDUFAF3 family protein [Sphingomonas sp. PR090111-T3T-6A]
MAKFSPDPVAAGPAIRGFSGGGFRIDEQVFADGALLTPETAVEWQAPAIEALDLDAIAPLLAHEPTAEFLLLGTGAALRRPSPAFVAALEAKGIGLEVMDSRAAAHAWGVLRAEGREIVAALMRLDR